MVSFFLIIFARKLHVCAKGGGTVKRARQRRGRVLDGFR